MTDSYPEPALMAVSETGQKVVTFWSLISQVLAMWRRRQEAGETAGSQVWRLAADPAWVARAGPGDLAAAWASAVMAGPQASAARAVIEQRFAADDPDAMQRYHVLLEAGYAPGAAMRRASAGSGSSLLAAAGSQSHLRYGEILSEMLDAGELARLGAGTTARLYELLDIHHAAGADADKVLRDAIALRPLTGAAYRGTARDTAAVLYSRIFRMRGAPGQPRGGAATRVPHRPAQAAATARSAPASSAR